MILSKISAYSVILPLLVGAITFKKLSPTLRKLWVLVILYAAHESIALLLSAERINNMPVFHSHTWIETSFVTWIYADLLKGRMRTIMWVLFGLFLGFSLVNSVFLESIWEFNSKQRYIAGIVLIIYTMMYFVEMLRSLNEERIERHMYFWMNGAYLIYFAGTLFLFIMTKEILSTESNSFWDLHSILNILLNLGLAVTLWMGARKST